LSARGTTEDDEPIARLTRHARVGRWLAKVGLTSAVVVSGVAVVVWTVVLPTVNVVSQEVKSEYVNVVADPFNAAKPITLKPQPPDEPVEYFALPRPVTAPAENAKILAGDPPAGAVPIGQRTDTFLLTGVASRSVSITLIRAVDIRVGPSLSGTGIYIPCNCGGGGPELLTLTVSIPSGALDAANGTPYFSQKSLSVSQSDRKLLILAATPPAGRSASWVYEFDVVSPPPANSTTRVYADRLGNLYKSPGAIPASRRFSATSESPKYAVVYGADSNYQPKRLSQTTLPSDH
jgi:hypothetical protein